MEDVGEMLVGGEEGFAEEVGEVLSEDEDGDIDCPGVGEQSRVQHVSLDTEGMALDNSLGTMA